MANLYGKLVGKYSVRPMDLMADEYQLNSGFPHRLEFRREGHHCISIGATLRKFPEIALG